MKPAATRFFSRTLLLLTGVVLSNIFCGNAYAQNARQASKPQTPKQVVMTEFEGMGNSGSWTFLSKEGLGTWQTGEEAVLGACPRNLRN